MEIFFVLLVLMTLFSLWSVIRGSLIRAAISLAITSAVLSVIMFQLLSPLAAVFELSVCAGLITVIFMSTISLAEPLTYAEAVARSKARIKRFWFLPLVLVILGALLIPFATNLTPPYIPSEKVKSVYTYIWNIRQLDVLGQIIVLFAGVFGVVVYFKNVRKGD